VVSAAASASIRAEAIRETITALDALDDRLAEREAILSGIS
jgi:hypothetical protein